MNKAGYPSLPSINQSHRDWWFTMKDWCMSCWQMLEITHKNVRLILFFICLFYIFMTFVLHNTYSTYFCWVSEFGPFSTQSFFTHEKRLAPMAYQGGFRMADVGTVDCRAQVSLQQPRQFMWFRHLVSAPSSRGEGWRVKGRGGSWLAASFLVKGDVN